MDIIMLTLLFVNICIINKYTFIKMYTTNVSQ